MAPETLSRIRAGILCPVLLKPGGSDIFSNTKLDEPIAITENEIETDKTFDI